MRKTKELDNILKEWNNFKNKKTKNSLLNIDSIDIYSTLLETYENRNILNSNNYLMNEFVVKILLDENIRYDSELLSENFLKRAVTVLGMIAALNGTTVKKLLAEPMSEPTAIRITNLVIPSENEPEALPMINVKPEDAYSMAEVPRLILKIEKSLKNAGYRYVSHDSGVYVFENSSGRKISPFIDYESTNLLDTSEVNYYSFDDLQKNKREIDLVNYHGYKEGSVSILKLNDSNAITFSSLKALNISSNDTTKGPSPSEIRSYIDKYTISNLDRYESDETEIESLEGPKKQLFNRLTGEESESTDSEEEQSGGLIQKAQDLIDLIRNNFEISAAIFGSIGVFVVLARIILSARPKGADAFKSYIRSGKRASDQLYKKRFSPVFENKYGADVYDAESVQDYMENFDEDDIEDWIFTNKQIDKLFRHIKSRVSVSKKAKRKIKARYNKETFRKFKSISNSNFRRLAIAINASVLKNTKIGKKAYLYHNRSGFDGKIHDAGEIPNYYYEALGGILEDSDIIKIKEIDNLFNGFMYFVTQTTFNETITEEYAELEKYISNIEGVKFNNGEVFISDGVNREDIENLSSRLAQTKILTNNRIRVDYNWQNNSSRDSAQELNRELSNKISYAEKIMIFFNFVKETKEYADIVSGAGIKKILIKLLGKALGDQGKEKIERKIDDVITDVSGDNLTFSIALKMVVKILFG